MGFFNNFGYVLIYSSAQDLGRHFHEQDLMAAFGFFLIFFSMTAVTIHNTYFVQTRTSSRILAITILFFISFMMIGLANLTEEKWGFFTALFGTTIQGCAQSVGEVVNIGFQKAFPVFVLSGWSSGTGFAGLGGTAFCLLLKALDVPP